MPAMPRTRQPEYCCCAKIQRGTKRYHTSSRRRMQAPTSLAFLPYSAMAFSTSAKPATLFREEGGRAPRRAAKARVSVNLSRESIKMR